MKLRVIMSAVIGLAWFATVFNANGADEEVLSLGPTGLSGVMVKAAIKVTKVDKGSPADGRISAGDMIVGVGSTKSKGSLVHALAVAIDEAETEKAGGKLTLRLKGDKIIDLQLAVLGRYSPTAPYDCPKSKAIISRAAEALIRGGKADQGATHSGLLGLMATGEKKYIDAVAQIIKAAKWAQPNAEEIDLLFKEEGKDLGYVGWTWGYNLITLAEYYLLTKDESVLPAIRIFAVSLARGQDAGGLWGHRMATPRNNGRLPGYAQMNQPSISNLMGLLLARKCGIKDPVLDKGIATTYAYVASHAWKGSFPYGVHGPNNEVFNNNGMSGSAAICMALQGNWDAAKYFSQAAAATYEDLEKGHASPFFNPLWTPLGASLSGPEVTQQFLRNSLWFFNMRRSADGGFTGDDKPGSMNGVALLVYCLPRKVLLITGRGADESIWVKGQAASDVINLKGIDYKAKTPGDLMALAMNHSMPQVRRDAGAALNNHREKLLPTWVNYLKEGTPKQKELALSQYGAGIPLEQRLPQLDSIGAVLRDSSADIALRAAAAEVVCGMGEPAQKYYMDVARLIQMDKPSDPFCLTDIGLARGLNELCEDPFAKGLISDKATFYKAALKMLDHKRQHGRSFGLRMLSGIPLEDFHIVSDKVIHVISDKDRTYHSYHNPGGTGEAGIEILANLNIKEGMDYALAILDSESGKGSFKLRAAMDCLAKYGANAKPYVEKFMARPGFEKQKIPENRKLSRNWRNLMKAVESDKSPRKLITLEEANKAGKK